MSDWYVDDYGPATAHRLRDGSNKALCGRRLVSPTALPGERSVWAASGYCKRCDSSRLITVRRCDGHDG